MAYWKYHKPVKKTGTITFQHGGKKLKIEFQNQELPSIDKFTSFFSEPDSSTMNQESADRAVEEERDA